MYIVKFEIRNEIDDLLETTLYTYHIRGKDDSNTTFGTNENCIKEIFFCRFLLFMNMINYIT